MLSRRTLVLALLPLLAGCPNSLLTRADDGIAAAALNTAVGEYWKAIRWGEASDLFPYFSKPEDQAHIAKAYAEQRVRMQDSAVLFVSVGAELPADRAPATREGIVSLRVESFDSVTGRLKIETMDQHWIYVASHWYVDTEKSPLGEARAW